MESTLPSLISEIVTLLSHLIFYLNTFNVMSLLGVSSAWGWGWHFGDVLTRKSDLLLFWVLWKLGSFCPRDLPLGLQVFKGFPQPPYLDRLLHPTP